MGAVFWGCQDQAVAALGASTTRYAPCLSNVPMMQRTTEAQAQVPFRQGGGISGLYCRVITGSRTGASILLRKNGADTALAITINAAGTYTDDADTITVVAGDLVNYAVFGGTGGAASYVFAAIGCVATLDGHTTATGCGLDAGTSLSAASVTTFLGIGGAAAQSTTEASVSVKLHGTGTIRNLAMYVLTNARSTLTTVTLRKNGADQAVTVSYAAAGVGLQEDTTHSFTYADGDLVTIGAALGTGAGAIVTQWVKLDIISDDRRAWLISAINNGISAVVNTTRYYAAYGTLAVQTTEANAQNRAREVDSQVTRIGVRCTANTLSVAATLTLRKDTADSVQAIAVGTGVGTGWIEDGTPDAAVDLDDTTVINHAFAAGAGSGTATFNLMTTEITGAAPPPPPASLLYAPRAMRAHLVR